MNAASTIVVGIYIVSATNVESKIRESETNLRSEIKRLESAVFLSGQAGQSSP
jgi:hypothetical protein